MALNLLRAGYRVTVKGNRNRAPVEALTNAGAAEASEYLQLTAQSDIIVLCLPNSTVVEGVISSMLPGLVAGRHVIVDTGTSSLVSTGRLARQLGQLGISFAEAPLTG